MEWAHLLLPVLLPTTGRREEKRTYTPNSLTNHPKALNSLLIALGLRVAVSLPPT